VTGDRDHRDLVGILGDWPGLAMLPGYPGRLHAECSGGSAAQAMFHTSRNFITIYLWLYRLGIIPKKFFVDPLNFS